MLICISLFLVPFRIFFSFAFLGFLAGGSGQVVLSYGYAFRLKLEMPVSYNSRSGILFTDFLCAFSSRSFRDMRRKFLIHSFQLNILDVTFDLLH